MVGGSKEVEFLLIYSHEEHKEEICDVGGPVGGSHSSLPQPAGSLSLPEDITLLASQETLSSSGEQPRAPQRWKNPPTLNDCRQEEVLDYFRHYRYWVLLLLIPGKLPLFLSSFMSLILPFLHL